MGGGRERRACVAVGVGRVGPAPPPPAQPSTRPPPRARASPREAPADARTERSSSSSAWASPAPTPLPPGVSRSRPRPALPFCGRDDGPKGTSDLPGVSNSCGVQARSSSCSLSISESPQHWPVPWWLDAHGRFCSGPTDHIQGKNSHLRMWAGSRKHVLQLEEAAVSLLEVVPQSFFQVRTLAAATHRVLGTQTG